MGISFHRFSAFSQNSKSHNLIIHKIKFKVDLTRTKADFVVLIAVITGKQICPTRNELKIILACNSTSVKIKQFTYLLVPPIKLTADLESLMRRNIIIIDGTKFWSSCQGQDAEFV